ncbi:hypothetical protein EDB19DRAFT_1835650 [Suillus lakei]|nr:hypothetical protein EDB19DRAFT_1835650 [Suillus lakei]
MVNILTTSIALNLTASTSDGDMSVQPSLKEVFDIAIKPHITLLSIKGVPKIVVIDISVELHGCPSYGIVIFRYFFEWSVHRYGRAVEVLGGGRYSDKRQKSGKSEARSKQRGKEVE